MRLRRVSIAAACLFLAACSSGPPLAGLSDQFTARHRAAAAPQIQAVAAIIPAKRATLAYQARLAAFRHERALARERARDRARAAARAAAAAVQAHAPPPVPQGGWQGIVYSMTDAASASCAIAIFIRESGGNVYATNPFSGAYGIPQALPGSKMASAGADWRTNPVTQIRWGLGYMTATYGSACGAWAYWQRMGYY